MRIPFLDYLSGGAAEQLAPMENRMAKRWVKERLKRLFPELRNNPQELEKAYRSLGIEPRPGAGKGGGVVYDIHFPGNRMKSSNQEASL